MTEHSATEATPDGLASQLLAKGTLTSDQLPWFDSAPREWFVPEVIWPGQTQGTGQGHAIDGRQNPVGWRRAVYTDISLTTQWDDGRHTGKAKGKVPTCSNSQPSMVFSMLRALDVDRSHVVLEIGTGTGWNAALLCARVGSENVVTIEVDEDNAKSARAHIERAGFKPISVIGDGIQGWSPGAPYDRVIFTASVTEIPGAIIEQTRPGGLIVAPYATTYGGEGLVRLTVQPDQRTAIGPFVASSAFMRLRQQRPTWRHVREYLGGKPWPADGIQSMTSVSPEDVGDWLPMFAIGMQTRGMFPWAETYDDGSYTLWLRDSAVTSWATVDYVPGAEEFEAYQYGPRNLWDEVVTAYRHWVDLGRPGFERFGLTISPDQHTTWLDEPHNVLWPT